MDHEATDPVFAVRSDDGPDERKLVVSGEVDMATAPAMFDAAVSDGRDGGPPARLVMDLTEVTFFDSAAIHALVRIADRYPDGLRVVPSPPVLRVLEISGLSHQPWLTRP